MQITLEAGDLDDLWNDTFYNYTLDDDEQYQDSICILDEGFKAMFIPVLYTIVFAVGVLENGALLVVLVRTRRNWSVTDTFILHLCIADVLLLVTLPFWASEAVSEWTFGTPLCKITGAVFTINFYCGIFLLACISLDRYFSIVYATQMYSRRNPCVVQISSLSVWLFSMLLTIPDWIFLEALKDERRNNRTECMNNYIDFDAVKVWSLATRLLYHIVGFLLPSSVLIFCYSCILRRLRFAPPEAAGFQGDSGRSGCLLPLLAAIQHHPHGGHAQLWRHQRDLRREKHKGEGQDSHFLSGLPPLQLESHPVRICRG